MISLFYYKGKWLSAIKSIFFHGINGMHLFHKLNEICQGCLKTKVKDLQSPKLRPKTLNLKNLLVFEI